jgi:hypothetical protein
MKNEKLMRKQKKETSRRIKLPDMSKVNLLRKQRKEEEEKKHT